MRERTTWTRSAATTKVADPYLMNQDHVAQQPGAEDYVIGDPSTFAEDVHPSKDTWEAEYAGGQVKRNEIGMPEMRKDTFNHPEKTAADRALLLKKANLCIKTAHLMLANASEAAVEDQAVALMHMPDADLINTYTRLANGQQQEPVATMQQQAEMQQQAAKAQVASLMQAAQECMANGDMQAAQECMAKAQECMAQAQQQGQKLAQQQGEKAEQGEQAEKAQAKQAQQQDEQAEQAEKGEQQKQAQQQQGEKEQSEKAEQQQKQAQMQQQAEIIQAAVAQAVQQVMAQMQQTQQAAQQQQAQQQGKQIAEQAQQAAQQQAQQQTADDAALADLLMEPSFEDAGLSEMGIEMEPAPMDVGEMDLGPEDDVLMTLFAADQGEEQGQQQQAQAQQKQAMSRTASTRTVGTRPTQGVSRVGGSLGNGGNDVNKLAALWPSAPDVSDAFR